MSLIENKSLTLAENEQFIRAVSVVSTQLSTKARLGAATQSFDPNAIDGDGDGIVQDGSPFERPAVISAITSAAQRLGKILSKASFSKGGRAKEYHRRHSGMSAQDIARDSVPANFDEWAAQAYERLKIKNPYLPELNSKTTPQDLKEITRQLEEALEPELLWMLSQEDADKYKKAKAINKNKAFSELIDNSFDFSPKTVAKNRQLVEHVLKTNPQFRELVNKHGMPPIFGIGENMDDSHWATAFMSYDLGMGLTKFRNTKGQGRFDFATRRIGRWFMSGLVTPSVGSDKSKRWNVRSGSPESLLLHEYGHYLSHSLSLEMSDIDKSERTKKWQAWRFSVGSNWKDTFNEMGSPEWYDKYKKDRDGGDVPQEIPHVETVYGESVPSEAWAEAIAATFAHDGMDDHLLSEGMKELIADFLSLDPKRDIREQLTPKRAAREIIPDGFASRGAVAQINKEKDTRYGDLTDPYELTAELLGTLDGDDPVGKMVRRLQNIKDDPQSWGNYVLNDKTEVINENLNIRVANIEETELVTSVLLNDPAFADMIRRHGMSNIYFSQTDLTSGGGDVRGVLAGGFTPDDSDAGQLWAPRIVLDLIGAPHERNLPDEPMQQQSREKVLAYGKGRAPGNITRTHLSRSDKHLVRHEGGHSIHDNLWEKQHRGEITGRRAQLIRAYSKPTWEEFYKELDRPDLWREHQRAIRAGNNQSTIMDSLRRLLPGSSTAPSPEIGQVDSVYAWFSPKEMFAESFSAYTSSNPYYRELLNDTMIDHLQSMLGDADTDQPGYYGNPPALVDEPKVDIPEPPPWDGFASTGKPIKSYSQLRRNWVGAIYGNGRFTRSEFFKNTTTDQKVDLVVPRDEREAALMAWDQQFEAMGLTWDQVDQIDLSDPFNPEINDPGFDTGVSFNEDTLDFLEYYGALLRQNSSDFSPEVVQANRDALRSALDAFPRLREVSERYGIPPITTMSGANKERLDIVSSLFPMMERFKAGEKLDPEFQDAMPAFMEYVDNGNWSRFIQNPAIKNLLGDWQPEDEVVGGYDITTKTISLEKSLIDAYIDGTRVDHKFSPEPGNFLVGGNDLESTLLHEYAHYLDAISNSDNYFERLAIKGEISKLFENASAHIKTEYGRTNKDEFVAEIVAAVLSGSRDQEEMLSPEARRLARRIAGLPENDPVFAGRIPGKSPSETEVLADRFGELWRRTTDGLMEPLDKERGLRSRDGVPDVLETMMDAKLRTGLNEFPPVEFEHNGRTFAIREVGETFEIEINGRTVARANVTPGKDGLPEINNVDVLPGYSGIAPDKDLHEMIVDHARKKYPSARAPRRARKTEVVSEGFASIGPEHHDARGIDGTPGTPEYTQAIASELAAAQAEGKKVFFDYNGETREVTVTEIFEKNGFTYMKGNDALRNGEERMFRLDRVSMPKRVENPETGKAEVLKLPGKKPRRPVPIFTGRASEIFEGAESWDDVAARLSKGRYVFFDFETTGIEENPESVDYFHPGTPTQIGLVEIIDGKVTRRWSTHVNPGRPMSIDPKTGRSWSADNLKYRDPDTGELVNLTDEWLAQQKPLKDALAEMLEFIGPINETILGGQNHPYDDDVMKRAMTDAGLDPAKWNPGGFIDSQALAQSLLDKDSDDYPRDPKKGYKTVSLGPLATWLGHDMGDGWHSADADSEASYEAFVRLVKRAADHENSGKPVRRDLFAPGGGEKELQERIKGFEKEKSGFDWKVKKYQEQQSKLSEPTTDGFASRGVERVREFIDKRRRAKDPARWENLTPEQRDAATQASAANAVETLNALLAAGIDVSALRDLDRAELDAILKSLIPGGEARVSDYVTGDGKVLIEVSNATLGKVFMSLGLHVQVVSDDPNEHHLLENGINDMQKALKEYVAAVAKDPDTLLSDVIFMDWADKNKINLGGLKDPKKLEKAAKKFAEEFEINMCLYYKSGSNMLCGANIGIEREEMPQLGGRMKGDDTLAAKAIKTGLMTAKEFQIDNDKLSKLDQAKQDELRKLAKDPARVAELAKSKDPLVKELFDVLNWNDTEANLEPIADRAAAALGIIVDKPRFVDPATMLGAQNQLQGSKVENMADSAVKAVLKALPILEARFGRKPTQEELMKYLSTEIPLNEGGGLFQPTLTAGLPGGQIYMLDGHHRWAGLLTANKKLEAMGLDVRVQLNTKNYQTDIRSGLELGRAVQVAMGVKDAKLAGEDMFVFDPNAPDLTPEEFDKVISELIDPAKLVEKIREVREGGKFRETEAADVPGGQADRLAPRQIPIQETIARINMPDPEPKSRVAGVKPQKKGYRAAGTGNGWTSIEDHINLETERGNELFETHQEYLDKGYEVAWVTHTPKEAGRYAISADQVNAFDRDEISVDPANIDPVDLTGSELVGQDGEGGYLYARRKLTAADRQLRRIIDDEEELLDEYEFGEEERMLDAYGSDGFASVGSPQSIITISDIDIDTPAIYEEEVRLAGRKYKFRAHKEGQVFVWRGKKNIGYIDLDIGHSRVVDAWSSSARGARVPNSKRHSIRMVWVDDGHRRRGVANELARIAEEAYGGRVEHSSNLSLEGRAWRDNRMAEFDAPGADGFASMGRTNEAIERNENLSPEQMDQIESLKDNMNIQMSESNLTDTLRTGEFQLETLRKFNNISHPYSEVRILRLSEVRILRLWEQYTSEDNRVRAEAIDEIYSFYKESIEPISLKRDIKKIFEGDINIGGKKYTIVMSGYDKTLTENKYKLEFDINNEDGKLASRAIFKLNVSNDGKISIHHESLTTVGDSRNLGVMTEFLARQEALYREMGVEEITLAAVSNKYMNGVTHWARNGYDFATPKDRKKFINGLPGSTRGLKEGLTEHRELFTDEEYARLTELLNDPSATAVDLTDFAQAEAYFKITKPYVNMSRKLQLNNGTKKRERELVSASSGDGFASTGTMERPVMLPLDLVSGVGDMKSTKRGGKAQRDQEVVPDDFYTRRPSNIAGVRVPEPQRDEMGAPIPGAPIYRESMKIGRKTYTFEVDADGIVSVYAGRKYKMVAQMNLDRGHSHIGGRNSNKNRHHIDYVQVDKKHRRKGIATAMSEMAEHAYGGQIEHSAALTTEGRKFRDADMSRRGTPGADPSPLWEALNEDGFASRGSSGLNRAANRIAGRGAVKSPGQIIGEEYLEGRLDGYHRFGGNVSNTELNMLAIYQSWKESDEPWDSFVERFPALQSMIKKEMSRYEQQAATDILEDMLKERRMPRPSMTTAQREGAIRRVNNPQLGATNLMAESVVNVGRMEQQRQDLQLQRNYATWKNSGDTWEKFVADNPAIEKLVEKERRSGKLDARITQYIPGLPEPSPYALELSKRLAREVEKLKPLLDEMDRNKNKLRPEPPNNQLRSAPLLDAIKLTKAEQKILKEIRESGTPDFAKVVHAVALDYDEPGSILDNMKPTNMAVTMKNARSVSSEIQRQAQESLKKAGFPEEFSVWRTAGAGGRPNTGVVSVTTRKGGLGLFKGTVVEYRVSRSDVLTHGEGFLGNLQTYAEDELHVDIKKLRRVGSKLSSGKTKDGFPSLDKLAGLMNLDETETTADLTMGQLTGLINQRIATGEATLAEKLGITPTQLQERLLNVANEIDQFVDRFVNDKEVRKNVKLGFKILSAASILLGSQEMKRAIAMANPNPSGGGDGSAAGGSGLLDLVDSVLSAGIHEALIAYGSDFANLIAAEYAAMRLVTRQKAKEMIKEIKERIEGTGQYIGTMSNEMWARLRGAWAKTRPTAPIGVPIAAKQWIVAGSSPQWAEMSWFEYQAKSRKTNDLLPTDTQRWASIAMKVGQSPELIDIATYRAGIGYGDKRIKPRDVVRVHMDLPTYY